MVFISGLLCPASRSRGLPACKCVAFTPFLLLSSVPLSWTCHSVCLVHVGMSVRLLSLLPCLHCDIVLLHTHTHTPLHRGCLQRLENNVRCWFVSFLLLESESLAYGRAPGCLAASQGFCRRGHPSLHRCARMAGVHCCAHCCVHSWYPNSGPHSCVTSALATELSSRRSHFITADVDTTASQEAPGVCSDWWEMHGQLSDVHSRLEFAPSWSLRRHVPYRDHCLAVCLSFQKHPLCVLCVPPQCHVLTSLVKNRIFHSPWYRSTVDWDSLTLLDGLLACAMLGVEKEVPSGSHKGSNVFLPVNEGAWSVGIRK